MTETASNRQKVQPFDWRLPIAPNEKGVIVATKESRVVEWVNDFIQQCMGNQCVLRQAPGRAHYEASCSEAKSERNSRLSR